MLVLMKLSWCIHTIRIYPVSSPPGEGMTQHVESRISQGLSTSMCLCCFEIDSIQFQQVFLCSRRNAVTGTWCWLLHYIHYFFSGSQKSSNTGVPGNSLYLVDDFPTAHARSQQEIYRNLFGDSYRFPIDFLQADRQGKPSIISLGCSTKYIHGPFYLKHITCPFYI